MPVQPVRVGVIGSGGWGHHHAENYAAIEGVTLAACFDVDQARADAFAKQHGFTTATTDPDAFFERVDALTVVTPDRFHAEYTIAALRAGKHVMCEKPLTTTLDEARQVVAAVKEAPADLVTMVNFTKRNAPGLMALFDVCRSGELGEPRHLHANYQQSWLTGRSFADWHSPGFLWRCSKADMGGVLVDLGVHMLDACVAAAGRIREVRACLQHWPKRDADGAWVTEHQGKDLHADDTAIIEMRFESGALGLLQTTRWAPGYHNREFLEVHGTNATARFDMEDKDRVTHCAPEPGTPDNQHVGWTTKWAPPVPNNQERFIDAIRTGRRHEHDIPWAAGIQAVLHACQRSNESGRWEPVPSLG